MLENRHLFAIGLIALLVSGFGPPALASPPSYSGTYVVIDPYDASDMQFLACASETTPDSSCYTLSSSGSDFLNPFTGTSPNPGSYSQGANGILLRIPWCAFQTGAVTGQPAPVLGECHYQVWGPKATAPVYTSGTIYAGAYTDGTDQLYQVGVTNPQGGVDAAISYLSYCTYKYDIGGMAGCTDSVLDVALGYIVAIDTNLASASLSPLKLSIALVAGEYTPTSMMDTASNAVPTLDLPQRHGKYKTVCSRQPLPWHTSAVSPSYVANAYERTTPTRCLRLAPRFIGCRRRIVTF